MQSGSNFASQTKPMSDEDDQSRDESKIRVLEPKGLSKDLLSTSNISKGKRGSQKSLSPSKKSAKGNVSARKSQGDFPAIQLNDEDVEFPVEKLTLSSEQLDDKSMTHSHRSERSKALKQEASQMMRIQNPEDIAEQSESS